MNRKRGLADQGIGLGKGVCYAGSPSHGLSGYSWLPPLPYNPGCETGHPTPAKVAELVDAQDLGSCGLVPWGFESPLSHLTILGNADATRNRT